MQFAELARKRVEEATFDEDIKVTISLGIAEFTKEDTINGFLKRLDSALYESKDKGRNCCTISG